MKCISLLFAGDVMAHNNQLKAAYDTTTQKYNFSDNFRSIEHHIKNVDIAVCNLETTVAEGPHTGYPKFNTPEAIVEAIENAGFHCVATANNHSFDSGTEGIVQTRTVLEKHHLKVIGSRKKTGEKAYSIFDVQGVHVALLNWTYETARTNGRVTLNNRVIGAESEVLLNTFGYCTIEQDLQDIEHEIQCARTDGADIVIVYYHWGNEYERYSNVFQKYIAWRTAHMGVDAIIGSHAHVMQEISEIKVQGKTVPVFYGLGNYIWGGAPIQGRDTTQNNILALLDIQYNQSSREVVVSPSYIPMFIAQQGNRFHTIELTNLPSDAQEAFERNYKCSVETVLAQIRETAENKVHPVQVQFHFDQLFEIPVGARLSLTESFLPKNRYVSFRCEDAIIASVMQNGYVIGNSEGYVGITAVDESGVETLCMVHVVSGCSSAFPIIVNEYNSVRDIYVPPRRVAGEKYALPENTSLCEDAANAWKLMMLAARNEGIHLNFASGFRSKKQQLLRQNKYAAIYGESAAKRRYQKFGCSEHHLGIALDVNGGTYKGVTTTKAVAINWLQTNCKKFGFIARKLTSTVSNAAYVHLRYLEDRDLACFLTDQKITLEAYLTDYDVYYPKFQAFNSWKNITIEPDDQSATLSIYKICQQILKIPVPEAFVSIQHRVVPQIALSDTVRLQRGSAFFYDKNLSAEMRRCRNALRSGSVVAFASTQLYDELGNALPTIIVEDPLDACVQVGKFVRDQMPAKSICITGSAGKSTTTSLVYHVLASKFNTHMSKLNNANNRVNILQLIQQLEPDHEMYVQEVGGSFPQHIEKGAQMLQPDVAIITNIGDAHLDLYKTFENIKHDKLSLLENRRPGGLGLLNIDNKWLRERVDASKDGILTYSLEDPSADYFAQELFQSVDGLQFVIVEKSTGTKTPIASNMVGRHNAYNILCAFAVGRWAGMSEDEILLGLTRYQANGMRQHMCRIGGYHLFVDCFSSVEISLISSMETLAHMTCKPGAKKIAVVWGLMRLAEHLESVSKRVAAAVRDLEIDHVLVFGAEGAVLAEEMKKGKIADVRYTQDFSQIVEWIRTLSRPDDVILFKGQHMQPTALAIDCAFGTDFLLNNAGERKASGKVFSDGIYSGTILHDSAAVIDRVALISDEAVIPEYTGHAPIVCLNKKLFAGTTLKNIQIANNVVSIYDSAFENCTALKDVQFGLQLRYIGACAFKNCSALTKVELPRTCTHIEHQAFAGCSALTEIIIPKNVCYIADDAFDNCPNVKIIAQEGTYAYDYAVSKKL